MLIDTHCHLNVEKDFPDPYAALADAQAAGVSHCILVGVDLESSQRAVQLAEESEGFYAVIGWHPNYTCDYTPDALPHFESLAASPRVVAIGEIGLDYHWHYATPEQQARALIDQLELAERVDLPVVFHCREAYPDLLAILEARPVRPYLFHCFAGSREGARRAIELGAYFGVDGPITYKKAEDLRAVVADLPRDRVVIETDSPYMTPAPHRGKPNTPTYLPLINEGLAAVWDVDREEAARITTENAQRFFDIST